MTTTRAGRPRHRLPLRRRAPPRTSGCTSPGWAPTADDAAAGHRARRGCADLRRPRPALPRRAGRAVRRPGRARPPGARRGRREAGRGARLLPAVVLRAPGGDRAVPAAGRGGPRRPEPGLLHHRRRRGRRDRVEGGQAVLQADRQADEDQGHQPGDRLPRHHPGRAVHHRAAGAEGRLRAAGPRHVPGAQHQPLPGAGLRRRPQGVRPLGRRPDRAADPLRGPGHRRGGLPRAGAERRRLLPAAARATSSGCGRSATGTTCCWSATR